jgi:hypothetical protein
VSELAPKDSSRRWGRSAGAVFAGLVVNFLAVPLDALLHAVGLFPALGQPMSDGLLALAFSYRLVLAVASGAATARLTPSRPRAHALVLGGLGVVLSTLGFVAMRDFGHAWYPLSLIVIALPSAAGGARLVEPRRQARLVAP